MRNSILIYFLFIAFNPVKAQPGKWISEIHVGYKLFYTNADSAYTGSYNLILKEGIGFVNNFFLYPFKMNFDVYVHPSRHSIDSAWQKDWKMPDFKSECWMVASGISSKLDLLSPVRWNVESCEHDYSDSLKTQQLITHELIHVYHGQQNISPDFSNTKNIDWFVEGIATYASGQLDPARMAAVKKAVAENKLPESLNEFWTGKLKYGLSGSVVMYLDINFGREVIEDLLPFNKKSELLNILKVSEEKLLDSWKDFALKY